MVSKEQQAPGLMLPFLFVDVQTIWDEDDIEHNRTFPKSLSTVSIAIMGDDNMGAVVDAYMQDDKLIVVANYGDDGNYNFVVDKGIEMYKIESITVD